MKELKDIRETLKDFDDEYSFLETLIKSRAVFLDFHCPNVPPERKDRLSLAFGMSLYGEEDENTKKIKVISDQESIWMNFDILEVIKDSIQGFVGGDNECCEKGLKQALYDFSKEIKQIADDLPDQECAEMTEGE